MPQTVTGVIKALLAGPLPNWPVYRDQEDFDGAATSGYIVVHEDIATNPAAASARGTRLARQLVQVDIWQPRTAATPDDPSIKPTVERTLDAAPPTTLTGGDRIDRLRPESSHRQFFPATGMVLESLTVAVGRHLT